MRKIFKKCYDFIKRGVEYIMGKVNEMMEINKEVNIKKFECIEHCVDVTIELVKDTVAGTINLIKDHPIVVTAIGGALIIEKYVINKED